MKSLTTLFRPSHVDLIVTLSLVLTEDNTNTKSEFNKKRSANPLHLECITVTPTSILHSFCCKTIYQV